MEMSEVFSQHVFFQGPALESLKKDYMLMDMHTHTCYSHDSRTSIKDLLLRAKQLDIGFAVTDHVQAKGAIEACKQKKIPVIPGIEILTQEKKEILLYFYSPQELMEFHRNHIENFKVVDTAPKSIIRRSLISVRCMRTMAEIIDFANDYNCVKCVPHPYAYLTRSSHKFFSEHKNILKKIDAVEVINSSLRPNQNKKAMKWAYKTEKAFTAGSDAHVAKQLGKSFVAAKADTTEEFLDEIKKKHSIIFGTELKRREAIKTILEMNKTKRNKKW